MKNDNTWIEFDTRYSAVSDTILGSLDPTLLRNGMYEIRLTVVDMGGLISTATSSFIIEGGMKLGHLAFGKEDLSVKTTGLPLSLVREYDSRITEGDFGPGWSLPQKSVKAAANIVLGEGWEQTVGPEPGCTYACVDYYWLWEREPHIITIRYSDTDIDKFRMDLNPIQNPLYPIEELTISFIPVDGTQASLEVLGKSTTVYMYGGYPPLYDSNNDIYNAQRFRVTRRDGTKYVINTSTGMESMTDVYGHTVTYSNDGITHSDGPSITFIRDNSSRITRATDNEGRTLEYIYEDGVLVRVVEVEAQHQPVNNILEAYTPEGLRNRIKEGGYPFRWPTQLANNPLVRNRGHHYSLLHQPIKKQSTCI